MSADFSRFERYNRVTAPSYVLDNPEALYDLCVFASQAALELSYHYDGKQVSAVAPVWDNGDQSDGKPMLKIVSAGCFKPFPETDEFAEYTRVCAEQNLIDNGLKAGDTMLGVLFLRLNGFKGDGIEGNGTEEDPRLCQPCRLRALPVLGPNLVIVSFIGDSQEAHDAITLQQTFESKDFGRPLEVIGSGSDAKKYVIEKVIGDQEHAVKIGRLPLIPSRRYRRAKT
jgi:hypothetical protein